MRSLLTGDNSNWFCGVSLSIFASAHLLILACFHVLFDEVSLQQNVSCEIRDLQFVACELSLLMGMV
jgi:hypothetical protein